MGSQEQPVLEKEGDNLRIDWGYLYVAAARSGATSQAAAGSKTRAAFQKTGRLEGSDDLGGFRPARERTAVLAFCFDLGRVGPASVSRHLVLAYDDLFSIEYLHRRLRPFWRRNGAEASDLLIDAEREYPSIFRRSAEFDQELMVDLRQVGGDNYMHLCALAYRQAIAAHKLAADIDGTPLFFPKENFSNGCIGTVDVIYPSAPLLLLVNPKLLEASLVPVLDYARLPSWPFPFAPHDLGKYPLANGQVYGGAETSEENQMPIEESGNMLILVAAIAQTEGDAAFAVRYWPLLSRWAAYLKAKGLDPENQLSTDDFMGHLAHNANLSLKAILALGAYSSLCARTGRVQDAAAFRATAAQYARQWIELAAAGDHYRLAFDAPETWSQKYNLVWDRLLGLNLFPASVAQREIAFYKTKEDPYGVPLDSRKRLTKLDWLFWTASLAENRADFEEIASGGYRFVNHTPNRVPLADGNWTEDARQRNTAQARSVVGGVFIKMLGDRAVWDKWSHREVSQPAKP
jgi:hypothetical protein